MNETMNCLDWHFSERSQAGYEGNLANYITVVELAEMQSGPELMRIQFCSRCGTLTRHKRRGGNWYCSVCKQLWF